jgi:hypothetical protein
LLRNEFFPLDPGQEDNLSFAQDILVSGTTQVVGSFLNLMAVALWATSPTRGEGSNHLSFYLPKSHAFSGEAERPTYLQLALYQFCRPLDSF